MHHLYIKMRKQQRASTNLIWSNLFIWMLMTIFTSCHPATQKKTAMKFHVTGLQKIEVITGDWNAVHGKMYLWERKDTVSEWELYTSFDINVGRNGFAVDSTQQSLFSQNKKIKHEGDGCSPAGIFTLGKIFSYHNITDLRMPFKQVDENDLCVDDRQSVYYNTLIDADTIASPDYHSFETMRRKDDQYEYGVWVNYNTEPARPGNGSCIFLHIWKDPSTGTSGCTSMSRNNMLQLIHWLDENKNPVLVQFVDTENSGR